MCLQAPLPLETPHASSDSQHPSQMTEHRSLPPGLARSLQATTIPKIGGLRAVSAFFVIAYHYGFAYVPAGFGVLVFFVISGFLITWLILKEADRNGRISLTKFYARRSLRIFPAFYVYWILVTAALLITRRTIIWPQAIASFFYVANYYQGLHGYPNSLYSHTWSLGIEEQFYLLWPAAFILFGRSRSKLLAGVLGAIIAIWIYRIVLDYLKVPEAYIYTAFDTRVDHLLVGCALAIALRQGLYGRLWGALTRPGLPAVTLCLLAASVTAGNVYGYRYRDTLGFALDPVLVAILIVQLLASRSVMTRWLDAAPIAYLGTISYSTYLYQQLVVWPLRDFLLRSGLPDWLSFAGCVAAVWLIAALSYRCVEQPFLNLRKRFSTEGTFQARAARPRETLEVLPTPTLL
jgi:peptidoglycan/LPS O-acetylase OafA/YrhL